MKNTLLSAVALFATTSVAGAGVCGPDRDTDIPVIERAKEAFLTTNYREFIDIGGDMFPGFEQSFDSLFGPIQEVFPNGYERCETILQRREEPGFHQELVFFFPKGFDGPVTLHLIVAEVAGEMRMISFNYNTAIGEVLGGLK